METTLLQKGFFYKMAKTTFLAIAMATGMAGANAQISTFPWTETFETNSPSRASWTQIYESGTMAWTFAADATTGSYDLDPFEGALVANFPANSWGGEKTKLVSPVLDLTTAALPELHFYYVNPYWGSEQNILKIFYRTSAGSPWNEIAVFNTDIDPWTSSGNISLPNPSATYQIALEGHTLYGYSIMVDQLTVTGMLATAGFDAAAVKVYPNPTNGIVHVDGATEIQSVEVYNLSGQQVMVKPMADSENQLDLSPLASGNYFLKIHSHDAFKTVKIVRE